MAADATRFEAAARGEVPAAFRLYRWRPGCVTLGRAQPRDLLGGRAADAGLDLVTRRTGGRALLHAPGDLTYSVVVPADHPVAAGDLHESYRRISGAVLLALRDLGVPARFGGGTGRASRPDVPGACFEEHLAETITAGDRKVCGSAQARSRGAILQHGGIPMRVDHAAQAALFYPGDPGAAARLSARYCGVLDVLGPSRRGETAVAAELARLLWARLAGLLAGPGAGGAPPAEGC